MTLFRCDGELVRDDGEIGTLRLFPRQIVDFPTIAGASTSHQTIDLALAFAVVHIAIDIRERWLRATGRASERR